MLPSSENKTKCFWRLALQFFFLRKTKKTTNKNGQNLLELAGSFKTLKNISYNNEIPATLIGNLG